MPYYNEQKQHALRATLRRIHDAVYTPIADLTVDAWVTPEPVPYAERQSGKHLHLRPGDKWGNLFDCAWFHFSGQVPETAAGQKVVLLIDVNGEACVVDQAGNPVQGLTNVSSEFSRDLGTPGKRVVPLAEKAAGGEQIDLWADAGCNDLFGRLQGNGTLKEACIAVCHPQMHALLYDFEVLHELMHLLPEHSARRHTIWAALNGAAALLRSYSDDEAALARRVLAPELAKRGGDPSLTISAIGHAHIDLGWLWPIRETIRKGARTFSTALRLMERYPNYVFGASQPQLYQWMKERYPALYGQVKQRVAEGRWEAQGAMWVEADTNIPSGESLVRQILYGKRFFRNEFGKEMTILWLPDVFGYSAALPQILAKSGVKCFMTQKISWNLVNRFPHHTFRWQGIDGTQVLAHMLPEENYNSPAAPRSLARIEQTFQDKSLSDRCLMLFGIGDGGGGPGEEHLERLMRERDLAGVSPVVQEPADLFFQRILPDKERYPLWVGELYLERHQGTYTTQARNKRYNRKMEIALRQAEWSSAVTHWLWGLQYPSQKLDEIWREVLLYQFHDILPGSSITRVYDESLARYAVLLAETEAISKASEEALIQRVSTQGMTAPVVAINSLSWARSERLKTDGRWIQVTVPPMGYAVVDAAAPQPAYPTPSATETALENDLLRVTFAPDGSIASVWDKVHQREVIQPGATANRLAVYEDHGDAWDFAMDYDERDPDYFRLVSSQASVDGPRAVVTQLYTFGDAGSTLKQEIALMAGTRRIDFVTEVDWRESNKMLRTSFPVAVRTSEATCEIQFGSLRRPTHRNTSWDLARFEVCAQKWVDLSDRGYGVALLNDCKYGHKLLGNTLDLNLLRSPGHPDPKADRAVHQFTYCLLPHAGDHVDGGVVRAAHELNVPLRVAPVGNSDGSMPSEASFLSVDAPGVLVDTVKKAEDSDHLIVRLYEAHGASTRATITFGTDVGSVELVDLMEDNAQPLTVEGRAVTLAFGPYEVHSLRVGRAQT